MKSSGSRYWRCVRKGKLVQLAGNKIVPWFCLFCFHLLQVQRPKLQVLDSLEKKNVTFFSYSGIKGTWKSTGLLNPNGKPIKNGTFS